MVKHELRRTDHTCHDVVGMYSCKPTQYGSVAECLTKHHRIESAATLQECAVALMDSSNNLHRISLEHVGERYSAIIPVPTDGISYFRRDQLVEVVRLQERPCLQQIELCYAGLDAQGLHAVQISIAYYSRELAPRSEERPTQQTLRVDDAYPAKLQPDLKRPLPEGPDNSPPAGMRRVPSLQASEGSLERNALGSLSDTDLAARRGDD
mmetsp:Transcript_41335/g.102875  ORF Transcript_41335/g.102875 Transcript_41335/m.102875 type:complete len:209 (-) Transcript_41335:1125-1751(-)